MVTRSVTMISSALQKTWDLVRNLHCHGSGVSVFHESGISNPFIVRAKIYKLVSLGLMSENEKYTVFHQAVEGQRQGRQGDWDQDRKLQLLLGLSPRF